MTDKKKVDEKGNSGDCNSGSYNSGSCNSGSRNSGDCNSGDCNSGSYNSGSCNSGSRNSGDCNSGSCNSGSRNSGDCNSGYRNSGDCNSGYYNSGDCNSGSYNSGDCNSGYFCRSKDPEVMSFDKPSGLTRSEFLAKMPPIYLKLTEWIENNSELGGGHLVTRTYREAWRLWWDQAPIEDRNKITSLPNFDAGAFLDITGIEIKNEKPKAANMNGQTIEINGQKYKLQRID